MSSSNNLPKLTCRPSTQNRIMCAVNHKVSDTVHSLALWVTDQVSDDVSSYMFQR